MPLLPPLRVQFGTTRLAKKTDCETISLRASLAPALFCGSNTQQL